MCIDDKLEKIKPFLVSLRYSDNMPVMDVAFKKGWAVPNSKTIQSEEYPEIPNTHMFFSEKEGITMDDMVTYVAQVIALNVEREDKIKLYQTKVKELQEFFSEHELSELEDMEFVIKASTGDWAGLTNIPKHVPLNDDAAEDDGDITDTNEEVIPADMVDVKEEID